MLKIGAQRPEDLWRKQRRQSILRSMSTSPNSYEDSGEKAEDVEARKPNNNIGKTKMQSTERPGSLLRKQRKLSPTRTLIS